MNGAPRIVLSLKDVPEDMIDAEKALKAGLTDTILRQRSSHAATISADLLGPLDKVEAVLRK